MYLQSVGQAFYKKYLFRAGSILPQCFKKKNCLQLRKTPGKKQDPGKCCLKTNPAIVFLSLFKIQAKF